MSRKKYLYLVSREITGYDEFNSAVICAYSYREAISEKTASWQKVSRIGVASNKIRLGIVISSFHAG